MSRAARRGRLAPLAGALGLAACAGPGAGPVVWPETLEPATRVAVVEGFLSPESVKYDPEQDLYFVGSFNVGGMTDRDNNGFISTVGPDGEMRRLKFIEGGVSGATLHAPKGMYLAGDTLWVVDADALRGFHRRTGAQLASVDLTELVAGLPNDVAAGPDGAMYVTDTRSSRVFRVANGTATVAVADSVLRRPNGIIWDASAARFVIAPLSGNALLGWRPGESRVEPISTNPGGSYDGVEVIGPGRYLVTAQSDSSVQIVTGGTGRVLVKLQGRPADHGLDTRRRRIALPFMAQNRVEIWELGR